MANLPVLHDDRGIPRVPSRRGANSFKNILGQTFGRLAVCARAVSQGSRAAWLCRCTCGKELVVLGKSLRSGNTRSCGCLLEEMRRERPFVHGHNRRRGRSPEYRVWANIRQRCTNPANSHWKHYGGRGITLCPRWLHSFALFIADVGPRPAPGMTIDRIDVNRGYEPGNVRWVDKFVNANNRRHQRRLTLDGETLTMAEWGRRLGIKPSAINSRLLRGWTVELALRTPLLSHSRAVSHG